MVEKYVGVSHGFPLLSPSLLEMIKIKPGKRLGYHCKERCLRDTPFDITRGMRHF
jgi:hypothetical protein